MDQGVYRYNVQEVEKIYIYTTYRLFKQNEFSKWFFFFQLLLMKTYMNVCKHPVYNKTMKIFVGKYNKNIVYYFVYTINKFFFK